MIIFIVLLCSAGILGASIYAGLLEEKQKRLRSGPDGQRRARQVNMAKAAGAFPSRKEN